MDKPLFSLIIPCHNPEKTIDKVFDSLTRQGIHNNELEIILVDDNSDNINYQQQIKEKYGFFNINFVKTNTNIHCPGNTRREGMKWINGKWLFFCDQDDFFEDNALYQIKNYIMEHQKKKIYVISTIMRGYNDKTNIAHTEFAHKQAWLHGKWYSMENLIIPYHINFKENLKTHEDIYFNSEVYAVLFKLGIEWDALDIYTYKWVDNPESLTRKPTNDRGYLFENFNDYFISASEPYWEEAVKTKNVIFVNQIMMTILHAYFYYESASYYEGPDNYKDIVQLIYQYIQNVMKDLQMTLDDIVNFVYADPIKYKLIYEECIIYSGVFIPKTSFRDFIYKVGNMNFE